MGNITDPFKNNFMPQMTEELYLTQKKLRKESGLDKTKADMLKDLSCLSPQASEQLQNEGIEDFVDQTSKEISSLDPKSEQFTQEAVGKFISSALEQEYGSKMTQNRGFAKMKEEITRQLLGDPEKMVTIENYISLLQQKNGSEKSQE